MTEKRFIYDGVHIRDNLNEIPPIMTHNDEQRDKFLDGLNKLSDENKELQKENEQLKEEIARQKFSKKIMRGNIKDYERAIKRLRKSYEEEWIKYLCE